MVPSLNLLIYSTKPVTVGLFLICFVCLCHHSPGLTNGDPLDYIWWKYIMVSGLCSEHAIADNVVSTPLNRFIWNPCRDIAKNIFFCILCIFLKNILYFCKVNFRYWIVLDTSAKYFPGNNIFFYTIYFEDIHCVSCMLFAENKYSLQI